MAHTHRAAGKAERPFFVRAQLVALSVLASLGGFAALLSALLALLPDPAPLCTPAAFAALALAGAVGGLFARRIDVPALAALIGGGEVVFLLATVALCAGLLTATATAGYAALLFCAFLASLLPRRTAHRRRL